MVIICHQFLFLYFLIKSDDLSFGFITNYGFIRVNKVDSLEIVHIENADQ